jgi:hypothetical protein
MAGLNTLSVAPRGDNSTDLASIVMQGLQLSENRLQHKDALAQEAYKMLEQQREFNAEMTVKKAEMGLKEREVNRLEDAQQFNEMMDTVKFEESQHQFDVQTDLAQQGIGIQQFNATTGRMGAELEQDKWNNPSSVLKREAEASSAVTGALALPSKISQDNRRTEAEISNIEAQAARNNALAANGGSATTSGVAKLNFDQSSLEAVVNQINQEAKATAAEIKTIKTDPGGLWTAATASSDPKALADLKEKTGYNAAEKRLVAQNKKSKLAEQALAMSIEHGDPAAAGQWLAGELKKLQFGSNGGTSLLESADSDAAVYSANRKNPDDIISAGISFKIAPIQAPTPAQPVNPPTVPGMDELNQALNPSAAQSGNQYADEYRTIYSGDVFNGSNP